MVHEEAKNGKTSQLVGVISDTHGLVRSSVIEALLGVDLIIHAGDIGRVEVIQALKKIAPVVAVRGNMDHADWSKDLPDSRVIEVDSALIYVLHDRQRLDLDPEAAGFQVVIYGHSHQPAMRKKGRVLYLNPGSAGPKRFRSPITLALLSIENDSVQARLVELDE